MRTTRPGPRYARPLWATLCVNTERSQLIDELELIALKVRSAIKQIISTSDYVDCELRNFPSGSCEVSSVIAGLYLQQTGISDVVQTVAERENGNNHVWLTVNGTYILDITADQFEDCECEVVVAEMTDFHKTFKVYDTRPVDFSYLIRPGNEGYGEFYSKVVAELQNT